ncbi:unnamed protein product [Parnassius mnemosyne]|uniref:Uncharacterized protein n=1 Tax=Parnassius mnemosyne TaxID=213953 RepID=A0AAV1L515_9NEOP
MKEECEIKGLRLNANKTKVLVFEMDEERTKCEIWVNQECLEQEVHFDITKFHVNQVTRMTRDSIRESAYIYQDFYKLINERY